MNIRKQILYLLTFMLLLFIATNVDAQCAMCKATAEKSVQARGLNTGILYLLLTPVFLLGSIVLIWYKNKEKFR